MFKFDFQAGRITRLPESRPSAAAKRALAMTLACIVLVATPAPSPASAQGLPAVPSEMEAVSWLEGEWAGSGWFESAPGQRAEFEGTERVESRMGGRVLVVEGQFTARRAPEVGDVPVHQALGVMSYDPRGEEFLFRTYTARGGNGEAHTAEVTEGRIVWGYDDPRLGRVRYTITRTEDGAWHEVGHASRDGGGSWDQFFEMRLERARE